MRRRPTEMREKTAVQTRRMMIQVWTLDGGVVL